jgi:alkyl hydroperoxide reductase subunit F
MYDVIIIGGGPAGLTATVYCIRKRLETLLITKDLGGKTNFRLQLPFVERHQVITGEEVVNRFVNQVEYLDFARTFDKVDEIETIDGRYAVKTRQGKTYEAKALIIATGARGQMLDVPGEREFMMRGLCYSAVSYAPVFIDREAAVVGDGDLAMRSVAELATHAKHVTLIAPTYGALDSPLGQRLRELDHVTILEGYTVQEVKGDHHARSLVVSKNGETQEVAVDGIFIEQDLIPHSAPVAHLVELDEKERIKINFRNQTSRPGIFAAGDVTTAYAEQVLIAVGEGAKAALSAYEFLLEQGLLSDRRVPDRQPIRL